MARAVAYLLGGPCDGTSRLIDSLHEAPIAITCKGETYHRYPDARGNLVYVTSDWTAHSDHATRIQGQRDVFAAWRRLTHVLEHRVAGERRRIDGARHRIKRAVR